MILPHPFWSLITFTLITFGAGAKGFGAKKQVVAIPTAQKTVDRFVIGRGSGKCVLDNHLSTFNMDYPKLKAIHSDPPIFEVEDFLSKSLCDEYIRRSQEGHLEGSESVRSVRTAVANSKRTSMTRYFRHEEVNEFSDATKLILGLPDYTQFEEPQIAVYEKGQQFTWHYDAMDPRYMGTETPLSTHSTITTATTTITTATTTTTTTTPTTTTTT